MHAQRGDAHRGDLLKQRIAAMQEGLDRLDKKIEGYDTLMLDAERRMRAAEDADRR